MLGFPLRILDRTSCMFVRKLLVTFCSHAQEFVLMENQTVFVFVWASYDAKGQMSSYIFIQW